ncbi:hypothetical protein Acr_11g0004490 [Actinidia rufa]|uniref:Uncharacterized protein n=1 Tax=Actinidia rufa TaxID=165716 RepID=A0A7J0FC02_9ERIC|nr:hypothetical protein Acr_11g0004490 [Actinidia rufa]
MALARTAFVSGSDCSELQGRGFPNLFCSDSLAEVSALVRPVFNSIHIELQCRRPSNLLHSDNSAEALAVVRPVIV